MLGWSELDFMTRQLPPESRSVLLFNVMAMLGKHGLNLQDPPSPPRSILELSPCFFVAQRHLTAREEAGGEGEGERGFRERLRERLMGRAVRERE